MKHKRLLITISLLFFIHASCLTAQNQEKTQRTWREPITGMEFVWIPGECFMMGGPGQDINTDEGPVHKVCVDGFWMGKYEVTNSEFRKFRPDHKSKEYKGHPLNGDNQPAVYVSWNDAQDFARWLGDKNNSRRQL